MVVADDDDEPEFTLVECAETLSRGVNEITDVTVEQYETLDVMLVDDVAENDCLAEAVLDALLLKNGVELVEIVYTPERV